MERPDPKRLMGSTRGGAAIFGAAKAATWSKRESDDRQLVAHVADGAVAAVICASIGYMAARKAAPAVPSTAPLGWTVDVCMTCWTLRRGV